MSSIGGVKCPYCFAITPVGIMGIFALPVNLALVALVNDLKIHDSPQEVVVEDLCCACNREKAVKICFNCDPAGCKLCEACCTYEHDRGFAPARAHKPISIRDENKILKNMCIHHNQPLTHYSEKTATFACQKCLEVKPDDIEVDHEPLEVVIQTFKSKLTPVVQNLEAYLRRVQDSHRNISIIQSQLRQAGPKTIQDIQTQFAKFQLIFQERQKTLVEKMEDYVSCLYHSTITMCYFS